MAITVTVDDLNIPLDIRSDADMQTELSNMIDNVKNLILRVTRLSEEDLSDQETLDFESATSLEVTARFYTQNIPETSVIRRYGPGDLFVSRDAGALVSLHYSPFITLE